MTELDQVWSEMLDKATAKALQSGRSDIAEYLRLKAANDTIRRIGVEWLVNTILELAADAHRGHPALIVEREEPHNFADGNSNMVGSLLRISHGVRCLTVEAGWTRTPSDGIMRAQALAFARFTHFGLPENRVELRLLQSDTSPNWIASTGEVVDSGVLRRHFDVLLDK